VSFQVFVILYLKVNCNICHAKVSRGGKDALNFGTSGMISHLRLNHIKEFEEYENDARSSEELSNARRQCGLKNEIETQVQVQPTIGECLAKKKKLDASNPRAMEITRRIQKAMRCMHYDYTCVTSHRHWQRMNFDECCRFNVQLYCSFTTVVWIYGRGPKIPVPVPAGIVTIPPVTVTGRKSVTGTSLAAINSLDS
jgi:hypothetical protein